MQNNEILIPQKNMNTRTFIGWIIFFSAVQWMALDMFLPALPQIRDAFCTTESTLNYTISLFVVFTAVGNLIGGPLSDKYGRKRPLLIGWFIFTAFTMLSASSDNVLSLVVTRSISAMGSGIVLTVTMAMFKDSLSGRWFQRAMTFLQSLAVLGPVFSPTVGSLIINKFSWRFIFIFLAIGSVISVIPILFMNETLPQEKRMSGSIWKATKSLFIVVQDKGFSMFLFVIAIIGLPFFSYLAVSSYIFIEYFNLPNLVYGLYYAAAAGVSTIAPFIYLALSRKLQPRNIIIICIVLVAISGIGMIFLGGRTPILFYMILVLFLIAEGMSRPLGMVVLLDQQGEAIGAASSVTSFGMSVIGMIGSIIATLSWKSYIIGLGDILLSSAVISLILLVPLLCSRISIKGL